MSSSIRNLVKILAAESVAQFNLLRKDMLLLRAGSVFHADASPAITAAVASDLATAIVRGNAAKASYNLHIASVCSASTGLGCHIAADATNVVTSPNATDQTSLNTLLNEIKGDYNAHRVLLASHPVADATNVVTSANATDLATSITLVNEIVGDLNGHYAGAFVSQAIVLVSA